MVRWVNKISSQCREQLVDKKIIKTEQIGEATKPEILNFAPEGKFNYWHKGFHISEDLEETHPEIVALKEDLINWGEEMARSCGYSSPRFKENYDIIYRRKSTCPEAFIGDDEISSTLGYKLMIKVV
jgi:hypothetical protein